MFHRFGGRKTFALVTPIAIVVALAPFPGAPTASAMELEVPIGVAQCDPPPKQLCTPVPEIQVEAPVGGELHADFRANEDHCSSIIAFVRVDGRFIGGKILGPGDLEGYKTNVRPGTHTVSVQAQGLEGGCNVGRLDAWGGHLSVRTPNE